MTHLVRRAIAVDRRFVVGDQLGDRVRVAHQLADVTQQQAADVRGVEVEVAAAADLHLRVGDETLEQEGGRLAGGSGTSRRKRTTQNISIFLYKNGFLI